MELLRDKTIPPIQRIRVSALSIQASPLKVTIQRVTLNICRKDRRKVRENSVLYNKIHCFEPMVTLSGGQLKQLLNYLY